MNMPSLARGPRPGRLLLALLAGSALLLGALAHAQETPSGMGDAIPPLPERKGSSIPDDTWYWSDMFLWLMPPAKRELRRYERLEARSRVPEVRMQAVLCQAYLNLSLEKYYPAFEAFRRAVEVYGNILTDVQVPVRQQRPVSFPEVLQTEFNLAEEQFGPGKGKFLWWHYSTGDKAIIIYQHVAIAAPASPLAPRALLCCAQIATADGLEQKAIEFYSRLLSRYPHSPQAADARIGIADAYLGAAEVADGDGRLTHEAVRHLRLFLDEFPQDPRAEKAREVLARSQEVEARRLYRLASFYLKASHAAPAAARRYLVEIKSFYANTSVAPKAAALLAKLPEEGAAAVPAGKSGGKAAAGPHLVTPPPLPGATP